LGIGVAQVAETAGLIHRSDVTRHVHLHAAAPVRAVPGHRVGVHDHAANAVIGGEATNLTHEHALGRPRHLIQQHQTGQDQAFLIWFIL
jgi:hypothetical protein